MMRELFNQCMQQHGGAIVNMTADFRNGMPGMGHSGAARAGMSNLTHDRGLRVGARRRARQRGGAGLDRLQRHGQLRRRDAADHPEAEGRTCRCAAWAPRPRSARAIVFLLVAGGGLHHRRHAADRRRARRWAARSSRSGPTAKSVPFDGFHRAVHARGAEVMPALASASSTRARRPSPPTPRAWPSAWPRCARSRPRWWPSRRAKRAQVRAARPVAAARARGPADRPRQRLPRAQPAGRPGHARRRRQEESCRAAAASSASASSPASACWSRPATARVKGGTVAPMGLKKALRAQETGAREQAAADRPGGVAAAPT